MACHQKNKVEMQTSNHASIKKFESFDIEEALNLSDKLKQMLENVNSLDFDIFKFKDETNEKELTTLVTHLMHQHNLFKNLKIEPETFLTFINKIQNNYNPKFIEYHNKTHGTDVCQTSNYFIQGCDLLSVCDLNDLELASIYIASACHDFEHPGLNNAFLVESRLDWALEYNDRSPLENHHISSTFMTIQNSECNILKNFSNSEFKDARKTMIELVLATDAALHFTDLAKFKSRITAEDFAPGSKDDKITTLFDVVKFYL